VTRRRRRGFTLVEVVVAAGLATALALALSTVLVSSSNVSRTTLVKSATEQQVRDLNETVVRFLRAATPMQTCVSPENATTTCLVARENQSAFITAPTATRMEFYAYTTATTGSTPGRAPDKVTVESVVDGGAQVIRVQVEPAAVTSRVTGTWSSGGPATVVRNVTLQAPPRNAPATAPPVVAQQVFSFRDQFGAATAAPAAIAVVVFNPQVTVRLGVDTRVFGTPVFVPLPGKGLR